MTSLSLEKARIARLFKRFTRPVSAPKKQSPRFRPQIEGLENRTVPALTDVFEIDGNGEDSVVGANLPDDWNTALLSFDTNPILAGIQSPIQSPPANGVSHAEVVAFVDDRENTDTSYLFQGGSKDGNDVDEWAVDGNGAPDKNEITNAYAAAYVDPTPGDTFGHVMIAFGADRFTDEGSAQLGFWFFHDVGFSAATGFTGVHEEGTVNASGDVTKPGDFLIISDFTNGGAVPNIRILMWVGGNNGDSNNLRTDAGWSTDGPLQLLFDQVAFGSHDADGDGNDDVAAEVNPLDVDTPSPWFYDDKDGGTQDNPFRATSKTNDGAVFFEGIIDLNGLGLAGVCISSFMAETRTSGSTDLTARLMDFAFGEFDLCEVSVEKTGDTLGKIHPEDPDPIDYTVTITNPGAAPLHPKTITDSLAGALDADDFHESGVNDNILLPGETWTLHYTFTAQPGAADPLVNTVTVVFSHNADLSGETETDTDTHSVDLFRPAIEVVKTGDTLGMIGGEAVNYTFTITNKTDGNLSTTALDGVAPDLTTVNLTDDVLGALLVNGVPQGGAVLSGDTNNDKRMGLNEVWTVTKTRVPQAGDDDPLDNTVTVTAVVAAGPTGSGFGGGNIVRDTDDHSVDLFRPALEVDKSGDTLGKIHPEDPELIDYTIIIRNRTDGNLNTTALDGVAPDLININLSDDKLGTLLTNGVKNPTPQAGVSNLVLTGDTGNDQRMDVGETWTLTLKYDPSSLDGDGIDKLVNTVTATATVAAGEAGSGFNGGNVLSPNADSDLVHEVDLFKPDFTIDKVALDADGVVGIGDTVTYRITITNTTDGDLTTPAIDGWSPDLLDISIVDDKIGTLSASAFTETGGANDDNLNALETWVGNFPYVVKAADFPDLINTVVATFDVAPGPAGSGFLGGNRLIREDTEDLLVGVPELEITKTIPGAAEPGTVTTIHDGEDAVFTITVTNVGNGTATGVVLTDTLTDGGVGLDWEVIFESNPAVVDTLPDPPAVQLLTALIGTLLPGQSYTITVSADTTGIFDVPVGSDGTTGLGGLAGLFEFQDNNAVDNTPGAGTGVSPAKTPAPDDWANIFKTFTTAGDFDNAEARVFVDDQPISEDGTPDTSYFKEGGSKDVRDVSDWKYGSGDVAPDKNDITHAYAAVYNVDTDGLPGTPDTQYLTFGAVKFDASGSNQIGFWFFKGEVSPGADGEFNGLHTIGDILVLTDFTQGGRIGTVKVFKWVGFGANGKGLGDSDAPGTPGFGTLDGPLQYITDGTSGNVIAVVNDTSTETSPWPYTDKDGNHNFAPDTFFEGAINTSALGLNACFNSFLAESRSSGSSPTAQLKDFALGNLNACRLEIPNVATVDSDQTDPLDSNQALIIVLGGSDSHGDSHGPSGAALPSSGTGSGGTEESSKPARGAAVPGGGTVVKESSQSFASIWFDLGMTASVWAASAGAVASQGQADEDPAETEPVGEQGQVEESLSNASEADQLAAYLASDDLADDYLSSLLGIDVDTLVGATV